jgi:hypothetical protein
MHSWLIQYWEGLGKLPRPVRKYFDNAPRVVYPLIAVDVVEQTYLRCSKKIKRPKGMSIFTNDELMQEVHRRGLA